MFLVPRNFAERDQPLLDIGKTCSYPTCHLVDFLPFKCQHCQEHFCGDHFRPNVHKCAKFDELKWDRFAPNCPLCDVPVAIPPEQDPNIRMEEHITNKCSVMTGKTPSLEGPKCSRSRCGRLLIVAIRCDICTHQFCARHRFADEHVCIPPAPPPRKSKLLSSLRRWALRPAPSKTPLRPGGSKGNVSGVPTPKLTGRLAAAVRRYLASEPNAAKVSPTSNVKQAAHSEKGSATYWRGKISRSPSSVLPSGKHTSSSTPATAAVTTEANRHNSTASELHGIVIKLGSQPETQPAPQPHLAYDPFAFVPQRLFDTS